MENFVYFMTIWNILRQFGIIYGLLVCIVCDNLVYFVCFGMLGPRQIWQPWCKQAASLRQNLRPNRTVCDVLRTVSIVGVTFD
jgi:hypothetical protein